MGLCYRYTWGVKRAIEEKRGVVNAPRTRLRNKKERPRAHAAYDAAVRLMGEVGVRY
jgi:hypothetical protein